MNDKKYLEGRRSNGDRTRSSKWDPNGSGKSGLAYHDRETRGWLSPGASHSKWSAAEPFPGRRGSYRDENIDEDRNRNLKRMRTWEEEESYGKRMSPGLDDWRQQSRQRLPKNEWKRSRRSRSPSRGRSGSPVRGFGRDSGPNDRSRSRSGQVCRDYTSGWCKWGDHCRFLHEPVSQDDWERQPRSVTPKYPMPHSRECPKGNRFVHHSDRRCRDGSVERAAEIACKYFAAGHCRNGNHCRFYHQEQTYPSPDKSRDGRVLRDRGSADVAKTYSKSFAWPDGQNLAEDKYEISGPTYWGETDRSVDDKWGHWLERDKKLSNSSNGDKINDNKKNIWLGDMDMWPEWNYSVQTSKPIDKQTDWPDWKPVVTKQETVQMPDAAVVKPSETNELYAKGSNTSAFPNSGVITNPQIQVGVQEVKVVNKPETVESISPHFSSGVSILQNNVSTEQLTAISASIVQLLANGQQFQQPYAQNMKGASPRDNEGPVRKDPALNMQSNENTDSIVVEKHEVNDNPPGFFPTPNMQKNIASETPEITSKNKTPSTENKGAKSVKENNGKPSEENSKVEELNEIGALGINNGDADDGKKGKEGKVVRAFKFALVEFVKEVLKPTWKEGQMSKDAYKNIVKKVVDKVTGSIQEANIPQTQEKIEQYISHSKPKLTKLVEAYVGKFQKDK